MDFHANSPPTSSSSSASSSFTISSSFSRTFSINGRRRERRSSWARQLAEKIICGILTCIFATVGSLVGAMTGALIGLATESGLVRGAGIGAISGAVFSIEVVESSVTLWQSNNSGIWSILYVIDIFVSLLSGRLVREKVGPAVQSAVQSQMSAAVDSSPFTETLDIFETGGGVAGGMSKDSVSRLGKVEITEEETVDENGEAISCSVCLQDFKVGETARSLPHCGHMFHLSCIDGWLVRHASCPLCRRDI
ncbi:NEP1-interacting protein 1-like [Iris pallida]|uniref:NEP1-interacting protein 1-like n=1 Tax=Iris pallida TaxID=29817 RepID=A0AAX6GIN1_IRIPA|nr:NEP1-interacting protein 1-like [Iris pallida]